MFDEKMAWSEFFRFYLHVVQMAKLHDIKICSNNNLKIYLPHPPVSEVELFVSNQEIVGNILISRVILLFYAGNNSEELEFSSRSGPLYVKKIDGKISLNFPLNAPSPKVRHSIEPTLE